MLSASTLKILFVTLLVTLFLFFTSAFISLKLGAMPWPIVFSIVVSAGLLRLISRQPNMHDVNMAQAGGTMGGLVAAAVVFVLPGMYLQPLADIPSVGLLSLLAGTAGLLGVMLSDRVRHRYVEELGLPYPAGQAGGELIREGFDRGALFRLVVLAGLLTGALTLLRDHLDLYVVPVALGGGLVLTFLIAPMGVGAGYILGPKTGLNWLAGAVLGIAVLMPLGAIVTEQLIDISRFTPQLWSQNVGMGLVLGSGLAQLIFHGRLVGLTDLFRRDRFQWPVLALSAAGLGLLMAAGISWWGALLTIALAWLLVPVAAQLTGATNLDPLEQFGILATFLIAAVYGIFSLPLPGSARYIIAFFVAVTTAVAGDIGHDFKSAQVVGTPSRYIVRGDLFAVLAIVPAMPILLAMIRDTFLPQMFTPALPAPQAKMVYNAFAGLIHLPTFFGSLGLALLVDGLRWWSRGVAAKSGEPRVQLIPLGIGIFLGWPLSFVIALGGVMRAWINRRRPAWVRAGVVLAAGIMGGEGLAGFVTAALDAASSLDVTLFRLVGAGVLVVIAATLVARQSWSPKSS